jgi:hypothetical protein
MNADNLGIVFSPCFLRKNTQEDVFSILQDARVRPASIAFMITNFADMFPEEANSMFQQDVDWYYESEPHAQDPAEAISPSARSSDLS